MTQELISQWHPAMASNKAAFSRDKETSEAAVDEGAVTKAIRLRLDDDSQFHGRSDTIQYRFRQGVLVLRGVLPSFYLKQLLQTALRDIPGVERIVNNVEVCNPWGYETQALTSPRHRHPV